MKYSASQYFVRNLGVFGLTVVNLVVIIIMSGGTSELLSVLGYLFLGLLIVLFGMFLWSFIRFIKSFFLEEQKPLTHFFIMILSFLMFILFPIILVILALAATIVLLPLI